MEVLVPIVMVVSKFAMSIRVFISVSEESRKLWQKERGGGRGEAEGGMSVNRAVEANVQRCSNTVTSVFVAFSLPHLSS